MKRGKDDEKILGPMFPRLHVNDAGKGGPRAPPRNRMALYEQFSIPTQRFSSGAFPHHPSNTRNLVHQPGSSQLGNGSWPERNTFFSVHTPSSRPPYISEKFHYQLADDAHSNTSVQVEQSMKISDEDDFIVPIFVQPGMGQNNSESQNGIGRERLMPYYTSLPMNLHDGCGKYAKQTRPSALNLRGEMSIGNEEACKEGSSSRQHSRNMTPNMTTRDPVHITPKGNDVSSAYQYLDNSGSYISQVGSTHKHGPQHEDSGGQNVGEHRRNMEDVTSPHLRSNSNSGEVDNDCENPRDRSYSAVQTVDADKGDDTSDTSMVDSMSGLDVTPDDVVAVIGQKHFWKARRTIANQQRIFAVQIFELHRLIQVQKLLAALPDLLLEKAPFVAKSSLKTPAKRISSKYVLKPSACNINHKDGSEKPNYMMEHSAENAVGRASQSSVKNGTQPSPNGLYRPEMSPTPMAVDPKMLPWGFHQSAGHQWLVPVMSPSEGLIYKPYSGPPGIGGASCGGCLPVGSTPFPGNFMNPAHGYSPSHHYGGFPGATFNQNYFPSYAMPVRAPAISYSAGEQMNSYSAANLQGQSSQLSEGRGNTSLQPQNSCNLPSRKSGPVLEATKLQVPKESELQGSVASSPRQREQGNDMLPIAGVLDELSLFPVAPTGHQGASQQCDIDQPRQVIKVVPHNPRSATESAARIFQAIQEGRKRYDLH